MKCVRCNKDKDLTDYRRRKDGSVFDRVCLECREPEKYKLAQERKALFKSGKWKCYTCQEVKSLSEFPKHPKNNPSRCKACKKIWYTEHRAKNGELLRKKDSEYRKERHASDPEKYKLADRRRQLKYSFNISLEDYEKMFETQGGLCGICGKTDTSKNLAVDHDRRCCPGKRSCGDCVRGLLCGSCNPKLGFYEIFVDEVEGWRNMRYVKSVEPEC